MINRTASLIGIAALFLATGTARAHQFVVLLQEGNETPGRGCAHRHTCRNVWCFAWMDYWDRGHICEAIAPLASFYAVHRMEHGVQFRDEEGVTWSKD